MVVNANYNTLDRLIREAVLDTNEAMLLASALVGIALDRERSADFAYRDVVDAISTASTAVDEASALVEQSADWEPATNF